MCPLGLKGSGSTSIFFAMHPNIFIDSSGEIMICHFWLCFLFFCLAKQCKYCYLGASVILSIHQFGRITYKTGNNVLNDKCKSHRTVAYPFCACAFFLIACNALNRSRMPFGGHIWILAVGDLCRRGQLRQAHLIQLCARLATAVREVVGPLELGAGAGPVS